MGVFNHRPIYVGGTAKEVSKVRTKAYDIFPKGSVGHIVSAEWNDYCCFIVAPDGSKEGWPESDDGDRLRNKFISYLLDRSVDWVELSLPEEGKPEITDGGLRR